MRDHVAREQVGGHRAEGARQGLQRRLGVLGRQQGVEGGFELAVAGRAAGRVTPVLSSSPNSMREGTKLVVLAAAEGQALAGRPVGQDGGPVSLPHQGRQLLGERPAT